MRGCGIDKYLSVWIHQALHNEDFLSTEEEIAASARMTFYTIEMRNIFF